MTDAGQPDGETKPVVGPVMVHQPRVNGFSGLEGIRMGAFQNLRSATFDSISFYRLAFPRVMFFLGQTRNAWPIKAGLINGKKRMMTVKLKDVAREAGVAVNTASSILNGRKDSWASDETKQRVRDAAKKMGYTPNRFARGLSLGRFNTIGLIIPDLQNPFYSALVATIETELIKKKFELIIEDTRLDYKCEQLCLDRIKARHIDGLIVNPINPDIFKSHLEPLMQSGTPVVVLGGPPNKSSLSSIQVDFGSSIHEAFRYLSAQGHRKVGFILHKLAPHEVATPRIARFEKALRDNGMESPAEFRLQCLPTMQAAFDVFQAMLNTHPMEALPTAFFCLNDLLAIGAMRAATQAGLRIPQDLSFIGTDDIPAAKFLQVSLTTISQPIREMAEEAVAAVLRPETLSKRTKTVLSGEFIIRESSGPRAAQKTVRSEKRPRRTPAGRIPLPKAGSVA